MIKRAVVILLLVTMLVSLWPAQARAQMAVEDLGVIASLAPVIASLAEIAGYNMKDLTTLANMGPILLLVDQIRSLSEQLTSINEQLSGRADGWATLTGGAVPCSAAEGRSWVGQASTFAESGAQLAMLVESTLARGVNLFTTLANIIGLVQVIVGTTSGSQLLVSIQALNAAMLAKLHTMNAVTNQVLMAEALITYRSQRMAWCLQQNRFEGWGAMR